MTAVTFEIFGDEQLISEFVGVSERLLNPDDAADGVRDYLNTYLSEQFESEGGRSGGWAALAPSTIEQKARKGLDPRILHATLAMRRALTPAAFVVHSADALEIRLGTWVPKYAMYHQYGTKRMPRRPIIETSDKDRREIVKIVQKAIVGQMKARGVRTQYRSGS